MGVLRLARAFAIVSAFVLALSATASTAHAAGQGTHRSAERAAAAVVKRWRLQNVETRCTRVPLRRWSCVFQGERRLASGARSACHGRFRLARSGRRWRARRVRRRCSEARVREERAGPPRPATPRPMPNEPVSRPPKPDPKPEPTPEPEPPPGNPVPPPARHDQLLGFSENAVVGGYASADQAAGLAADAGASIARVMFDWRWAEPYPNDYRFKAYDKVYNAYLARGIRPIFTILFAPWWTWDPSVSCDQWAQDCTYPPAAEHDRDIAEMAQVLATRYPQLAGIEVWNEPNLHWFWRPRPDVVRYTQMQGAVYRAVKEVAPSMPVVNGGLNNHDVTTADDTSMSDFLSGMYLLGGGQTTDAVNIHPYPNGLDQRTFRRSLDRARSVRNAWQDSTKPLWVSEVGFSTTGSAPRGNFSLEEQARGLVDHYRVLRDQQDVALVALYTLTDTRGLSRNYSPTDVEVGFGLVDRYLRPKPAYCAVAEEWTGQPVCPAAP